jgi:hypothetical protein
VNAWNGVFDKPMSKGQVLPQAPVHRGMIRNPKTLGTKPRVLLCQFDDRVDLNPKTESELSGCSRRRRSRSRGHGRSRTIAGLTDRGRAIVRRIAGKTSPRRPNEQSADDNQRPKNRPNRPSTYSHPSAVRVVITIQTRIAVHVWHRYFLMLDENTNTPPPS